MALSFKNKLKYNLYLWYFGLTKVRLIHFIRPKIIDVNKDGVTLFMPLDRRTRNHVKSMYIGAMVVGVDLVTGFTAMLKILESKKNSRIIIAYEPIWSIGTGKIPNEQDLLKTTVHIKKVLKSIFKKKSPAVLYGGSVY